MWDAFHGALESDDPTAWLKVHCPDPEIRVQVDELLNASEDTQTAFLATSNPAHRFLKSTAQLEIGERIGPYVIDRVLGEGGMGRVFEASQEEPIQRTVALKVIKLGMDSEEVVARFSEERQILARLQHPNIATVLDAGLTPDGRPYFAMEAVDGEPIDTYCDRRQLGIRERIRVVVDVCSAVQHAHQKGVIHRDIKPSNILVTEIEGRPVPKVIDFGIAKAVHEPSSAARTQLGQVLGTPAFMSPEQIGLGETDVDSRSDVYALGVLLFLLLVGRLPPLFSFLPSSPSPSSGRRSPGGNDSGHASSPALGQGFDDLPAEDAEKIALRRGFAIHKLRKELRGDLECIVGQAMAHERERRYASCSELAADLQRYLNQEAVLAGPPGLRYRLGKLLAKYRAQAAFAAASLLALLLLTVGLGIQSIRLGKALDDANAENQRRQKVIGFLVDIYRVADPELGQPGNAQQPRSAREILDDGAARVLEELDDPAIYDPLVEAIGQVYGHLGEHRRQADLLSAAFRRRRALGDQDPLKIARDQHQLGTALAVAGDWNTAGLHLSAALERRRAELGPSHPDALSSAYELGRLRFFQGQYDQTEHLLQQVLAQAADQPDLTLLTAKSLGTLGHAAMRREKFERAKELFQQTTQRYGELPPEHHRTLFSALNGLAMAHERLGEYAEAGAIYRELLARRSAQLGDDHPTVAAFKGNLSMVLMREGRYAEAEALAAEGVESMIKTLGPTHFQTLQTRRNYAAMVFYAGERDRALAMFDELCPELEAVGGSEHADFLSCLALEANLLRTSERWGESEPLLRRLTLHFRGLPDLRAPEMRMAAMWGHSLSKLGRIDEGEALMTEALAFRLERFGADHRKTKETWALLNEHLQRTGRTDQVAGWQQRLEEAAPLESDP